MTIYTNDPLAAMVETDIPGELPQDFVFSRQSNQVGIGPHMILGFDYSGFQATPWPMKLDAVAGEPFLSSDFLYVLVGTTFNAHASVNTDQLIAQQPWFPRMSVRIYLPLPPVFVGDKSLLAPGLAADYDNLVATNTAWAATRVNAVEVLQQVGIDASIAGTEADATRSAVGSLIADHFGFYLE